MRRRLPVIVLVALGLGVTAPAAEAFLPESSGGHTWVCGGLEPVAGVCVDSPLHTVQTLGSSHALG